jgi:hypothetical protein
LGHINAGDDTATSLAANEGRSATVAASKWLVVDFA